MITHFIEATSGFNWGKFMIGRFTPDQWAYKSRVERDDMQLARSLLRSIGKHPKGIWVFDLQTGEAAFFVPTGYAKADLDKHRVWVCPMFEPFLAWLYQQDLSDFSKLPDRVELPDAESAIWGYRREGPPEAKRAERKTKPAKTKRPKPKKGKKQWI